MRSGNTKDLNIFPHDGSSSLLSFAVIVEFSFEGKFLEISIFSKINLFNKTRSLMVDAPLQVS
jgi:hypothetical protein